MDLSLSGLDWQALTLPIALERWMIAAIGLSAFMLGVLLNAFLGAARAKRARRRQAASRLHFLIATWYQAIRDFCAAPISERQAGEFAQMQTRLILPEALASLDEIDGLTKARALAERARAFLDLVSPAADEARACPPLFDPMAETFAETVMGGAGPLSLAVRTQPVQAPNRDFLAKLDALFEAVSEEAGRLAK